MCHVKMTIDIVNIYTQNNIKTLRLQMKKKMKWGYESTKGKERGFKGLSENNNNLWLPKFLKLCFVIILSPSNLRFIAKARYTGFPCGCMLLLFP
jgi:hypothetical protein